MSILVVDDSEFIHQQVRVMLAGGGHEDLIFAFSAGQAFELLGMNGREPPSSAIDMVLMDVVMPDMNGIDATRRIKAHPGLEDLPVVIVTADATPEALGTAFQAGASDYIPKPLHRVELLARVDAVLRLRKETRQRMANERELTLLNEHLQRAFEQITGEMDLVATLQAHLLPRTAPELCGIQVETLYRPSGRASGDYYDYIQTGPNTMRTVVADVSGHGAQAAFIMAIVRTLFHAGTTMGMTLEAILSLVNSHLCQTSGGEGTFVTIFAADLDLERGQMHYLNAGHCPCLLLNGRKNVESLPALTPPAGVAQATYRTRSLALRQTGKLFLYTDGLFEWPLKPGRPFGLEPFILLCEQLLPTGEPFLQSVQQRLRTLTGTTPDFNDDLTAMLATWDMNCKNKKD